MPFEDESVQPPGGAGHGSAKEGVSITDQLLHGNAAIAREMPEPLPGVCAMEMDDIGNLVPPSAPGNTCGPAGQGR